MSSIETNIESVPYLSDKDIEYKANDLLKSFSKHAHAKTNKPSPVFEIIEYLGYDIDFRKDGIYSDHDILGGLNIQSQTIEINENLGTVEGRMNFTAAHEVGHIILHVPLMNNQDTETTLRQTEEVNILCRTDAGENGTKKDRIEIQADKFAAFLLMPSDRVRNTFRDIRRKPLNLNKPSFIDLLLKRSKKKRAHTLVKSLISSGNFESSRLAMINRLIGMGLIKGFPYQKNTNKKNKG